MRKYYNQNQNMPLEWETLNMDENPPNTETWWHYGRVSDHFAIEPLFETNCCCAVSLNKPILSYQVGHLPRKYQLSPGMTKYC